MVHLAAGHPCAIPILEPHPTPRQTTPLAGISMKFRPNRARIFPVRSRWGRVGSGGSTEDLRIL